jgi:hypothetical protein
MCFVLIQQVQLHHENVVRQSRYPLIVRFHTTCLIHCSGGDTTSMKVVGVSSSPK